MLIVVEAEGVQLGTDLGVVAPFVRMMGGSRSCGLLELVLASGRGVGPL